MMKFAYLLLFTLLLSSIGHAKLEEQAVVEGDINQDGVPDRFVTQTDCGSCESWEKEINPKINFQVFLSDPKTKKEKLLAESAGIICYRCGGVKGSAIVGEASVSTKGILLMSYFGGSRWSWSHVIKWRLNKESNKLELIGSTFTGFDTMQEEGDGYSPDSVGNTTSLDINYLNRKIIKKKVGKNLKLQTLKCDLPASYTLPSFADFNFEEFKDGADSCN